MLLATQALAFDLQGHVGVSTGVHRILALSDVISGQGLFARVEVGAGPPRVQGYLVTQLALHDADAWYNQAGSYAPPAIVGDVLFAEAGLGARFPFSLGILALVPHLDLGVVNGSSPIGADAYAEDVLPEFGGRVPTVGRSATGPWAQVGGDVGIPVIPGAVLLHLSADIGYIGISRVGLTLDGRLGLAARF